MRLPNSPLTWESALHRPPNARPIIMAHRGTSDELPENTLAAFQRALEQGADVFETDIRFTRDDEIILMHDATVDRTTNGTGSVANMTLREIKKLNAQHSALSGGERESIPTLAEFLSFTAAQAIPVALELKDDRFIESRDAERLINALSKNNALTRVALLSFNGARVRSCKRIAPQIPIGIITLKNPLPLYDTELMGPFYPLIYLNPLYFAWAKQRGKLACPLDPAPEPRLNLYRRLGVPALLTNHPTTTIKIWDTL